MSVNAHTRTVSVLGRLHLQAARTLFAVVNPWTAADIHHVTLAFYQGATVVGTLTINQANLNEVVRVDNLKPNTTYSIRAYAWQDAGETVPIDNYASNAASCTTSFSTTADTVLTLTSGIALQLADRTFSGSLATGLSITGVGGNPWTTADIHHVNLDIYRGATLVTSLVVNQASLGEVLVLNNLQANTGYSVQARAWQDAGETVQIDNFSSDAASCTTGFNTANDTVVTIVGGIVLTLRDRVLAGIVSTLAGSTAGYADGTGAAAQFTGPVGVAVDAAGNVYVADRDNQRIRKISSSGVVTTLAGSGVAGYADGTGAAAQFSNPFGVAVDAGGNVYMVDWNNHRIRKVSPAGAVTTLAGSTLGYADGTGATAQFNNPAGVALDTDGNVYVADFNNHRIRKVTPAGVVTTLAGSTMGYADGTGAAAQFNNPRGVAVDTAGNVYVADAGNHRIRKISSSGVVTTLAGSGVAGYAEGTGLAAQFSTPAGLAVDAVGNLYVADNANYRIRKVSSTGEVTTLAGSTAGYVDNTGAAARFNSPTSVAVDAVGNVYVADYANHRIRKIQ